MEQKDICIVGLGRFGQSVLDTLTSMGRNVVVIEEDKSKINKLVKLCLTKEKTLRHLETLINLDQENA